MASFSFNKPAGDCPVCTGLGTIYTANLARILDEEKSVNDGAILLWAPPVNTARYDTAHLIRLLQQLVDSGNTVIVVEHNLDVVKCADWVIDLGPEDGEAGGQIVAEGTPETIAACPESITRQMLKKYL
jgi:excinuclease ABC subunit A